jgi:hypothetical protein
MGRTGELMKRRPASVPCAMAIQRGSLLGGRRRAFRRILASRAIRGVGGRTFRRSKDDRAVERGFASRFTYSRRWSREYPRFAEAAAQ